MKFLLDTNSIYNYKDVVTKDIINIDTNIKIAEITKQTYLQDGIIDFRYKLIDKEYEYGKGKKICIHYDSDNSRLIAEVKERRKRNRTLTNDTTVTFRVNKNLLKEFHETCKIKSTIPSKIIKKIMKDYIKENKELVDAVKNNKIDELNTKYLEDQIRLEDGNDDKRK